MISTDCDGLRNETESAEKAKRAESTKSSSGGEGPDVEKVKPEKRRDNPNGLQKILNRDLEDWLSMVASLTATPGDPFATMFQAQRSRPLDGREVLSGGR